MEKNNWRRLYLENEYQLKQLTNDYNKLVEENNNIKDELKNNELDYTTIYINGVYEGKKYYKDKIREKIDKYREKLEKLHSQELWNEPEDSIKDFKYNHYLEAYKKLLEEK